MMKTWTAMMTRGWFFPFWGIERYVLHGLFGRKGHYGLWGRSYTDITILILYEASGWRKGCVFSRCISR